MIGFWACLCYAYYVTSKAVFATRLYWNWRRMSMQPCSWDRRQWTWLVNTITLWAVYSFVVLVLYLHTSMPCIELTTVCAIGDSLCL